VQVKLDKDLSETAGTRDHQGVLAWCEPFKYADAYELAASDRPLLACLDQVSDPRNLGAVIRSARGSGGDGRRRAGPRVRARDAIGLPLVRRRRRAPVVAVVTNLARYLADIKRNDLWVAAATGESGTPMWEADLSGGLAFVFGAEARACARSSAARAISRWRSRSSAGSSPSTSASPQRSSSTRRGGSAVAEPTLYLFDGFNLLHAGGFASPEELRDLLASWVAGKGARGVLVFDGHGADESRGPLEVRWAPDARHADRATRGDHRAGSRSRSSPPIWRCAARPGSEVRKLSSRAFLDELLPPSHADPSRRDLARQARTRRRSHGWGNGFARGE